MNGGESDTVVEEDPTPTTRTTTEENNKNSDRNNKENVNLKDPELFSCLLQPASADSDPGYIGIRRLLLFRKAESGVCSRMDWRCNGKGYVAYRNYIRRPRNWELQIASLTSTPGNSGRWLQSSNSLSLMFEVESCSSSRDMRSVNVASSHRTSFSSTASDNDLLRRRGPEPGYSFVGMNCIFDQCKASVTVLKFGHMSSDLLAYGASDGTLTVCTVSEPPSIIKQLNGHSKDVTDFDFTSNNQYIASSSLDKTVRVWELSKGICIRVIYGVSSQLCIRFHPVNNNFLSVGNAKEITVFNFSTGRIINKLVFDSEVTSMDHDHTGQLIFCGDGQGCIHSVSMNSHSGGLSRSHRHRSTGKRKSPVTTVQYRSFSLLARGPVLLTCTQDGSLTFFSVALEVQGYLTLRCSLKLAPRVHNIRASFCPLLSLEQGEYIVAGSEDSNVYFYDLTRPKHACVNKLQGHRFPVVAVAWNHGENLLASSDLYGVVIVWKRANKS
ncbi:WD repeat-containing protein 13 [Mangifera indica]|uniref:WD repeat-containing protein 13 n=1 Tax=Mangifera indica TaxID=29780 RepID=UPI001CFC00F3|nr:WD repeat-containing protein 13 [Mangifera indica]